MQTQRAVLTAPLVTEAGDARYALPQLPRSGRARAARCGKAATPCGAHLCATSRKSAYFIRRSCIYSSGRRVTCPAWSTLLRASHHQLACTVART
jgi:hypothetical protein